MMTRIGLTLRASASRAFFVLGLLLALLSNSVLAKADTNKVYTHDIELLLDTVFVAIREQRLVDASRSAEVLAERHADFLLGQLLHAELQATLALSNSILDSDAPFSPGLMDLILEAQTRVNQSPLAIKEQQLPASLLQLGSDIQHVVAVDLEQSRLYLINNDQDGARVINQHYAGSGLGGYGKQLEGDLRTPTGIYRVTQFRSDDSLPPLYGSGALTLNYPNAMDRLQHRTGSGIWLHGVPPNNLSRAPRSSRGCVVMPNDMLEQLQRSVDPKHTLVVLSGELDWTTTSNISPGKDSYLKLFERYQHAWGAKDADDLDRLHAENLFDSVVAPRIKSSRFRNKLASVKSDDITVLRYPDFPDLEDQERIMMRFTLQENQQSPRRVTLFWEQDEKQEWHIVEFDEESGPA